MENFLRELFSRFCKAAETVFYSDGYVESYVFVVTVSGKVYVVPINDKEVVREIVGDLCEREKPVAGVIVGEGWMKVLENGGDRKEENVVNVILVSRIMNLLKVWKKENGKLVEIEDDGCLTLVSDSFFGDYFKVDA